MKFVIIFKRIFYVKNAHQRMFSSCTSMSVPSVVETVYGNPLTKLSEPVFMEPTISVETFGLRILDDDSGQ